MHTLQALLLLLLLVVVITKLRPTALVAVMCSTLMSMTFHSVSLW